MKIKIIPANAKAIEDALSAINGKAVEHTFINYASILLVANRAEKALADIGLRLADRQGASVVAESGQLLPSAYKFAAKSTLVKLLRGKDAWFLVDVKAEKLSPKSKPIWQVWLAQDQIDFACKNLIDKNNVKVKKQPD